MTHIQKAYFVHGEYKLVSSGFFLYVYFEQLQTNIPPDLRREVSKNGPMLRVCLFSRDTSIRFQDFANAT